MLSYYNRNKKKQTEETLNKSIPKVVNIDKFKEYKAKKWLSVKAPPKPVDGGQVRRWMVSCRNFSKYEKYILYPTISNKEQKCMFYL